MPEMKILNMDCVIIEKANSVAGEGHFLPAYYFNRYTESVILYSISCSWSYVLDINPIKFI